MNPVRLMLLGAPGAGKGTQAELLAKKFNIAHISTGDMLRNAVARNTELGQKAKEIMAKGELVSDDIIINLVKERLNMQDCKNGFLLDGFPRTTPQAQALKDAGIKLDYVIELSVNDDEIVKRITGRRVHPASGRVYHIDYYPPKNPDTDDVTNEPLIQRADDSEEVIRNRLKVYKEQTQPLIQYYKNLAKTELNSTKYYEISGVGEPNEIIAKIMHAIND